MSFLVLKRPWAALEAQIEPFCPEGEGCGRPRSAHLARLQPGVA
ncbi:hypothetical protein [Pseudothauera hydrothermalis]|nr:hypothetical protein [Pseudothauera hydrothermalis]